MSGAFFNKKTNADDPGYQIDLIFDRVDGVIPSVKSNTPKQKSVRK